MHDKIRDSILIGLLTILLPSCGDDDDELAPAPYGIDARPSNATCLARKPPSTSQAVRIRFAANPFAGLPKLDQPLLLLQAPSDIDHWYVVQRPGKVLRFAADNPQQLTTFVDLSSQIEVGPSESGLLGLAFHPNFIANGFVFVSYTYMKGMQLRSRVTRFTANADRTELMPASETEVLSVDQPYANHNGGHLVFGPVQGAAKRKYLFYGLGDGGAGGDPKCNGQKVSAWLGSLLRIDVDSPSPGKPYGIPPDNPFASSANGPSDPRPEIYAWGFRNPWRFSFDTTLGELWLGDVGQTAYEEIDLVVKGGNYGWNVREGAHPFNDGGICDAYDGDNHIDPVAEYPNTGNNSVTGGYVYRGSAIPQLNGAYLFGDYVDGRVWGIFKNAQTAKFETVKLGETGMNISSFAQDHLGEVYLLNYSEGAVHKIVADAGASTDTSFPQRLSETGCVESSAAQNFYEGLVPYDVQVGLWSDGLSKQRGLALPDNTQIALDENGDMQFPVGTVLMKTFLEGERRIETRLWMHHEEGWAGYAYAWNDEQNDAVLLTAAADVTLSNGLKWHIPSRAECNACHTAAAAFALGPEVVQLNKLYDYPSQRRSNQIATWDHMGLFNTSPGEPAALPALPALESEAPTQDRAKAYLHANCSGCHRPGGTGGGSMDLRWQTSLAQMGICDIKPASDGGQTDARLLAPAAPERSMLLVRMRATDALRMPPLGTRVVDTQAVAVVEAWIRDLSACP